MKEVENLQIMMLKIEKSDSSHFLNERKFPTSLSSHSAPIRGALPNPPAKSKTLSSNMRMAIRPADIEAIVVPLLLKASRDIVERSGGEIDAVADLSRVVPSILVEKYMGISGPTREQLIEWTTSMFYYLFFPDISETDKKKAENFAVEARVHIDGLIAARKSSGESKSDALGRLLELQGVGAPGLSDEDIRNNLLGIVIGAIPTTSKCVALVLDYLLDHPEQMKRARAASLKSDWRALNGFVLECLRFNPFGPGLFRECLTDYKVGKGTWRRKWIRKGDSVLASTQSAMLDGRNVKRPRYFDPERPGHQYLPFGYGMHTCFGKHINHVQIAIIVGSLISQDGLQRVKGKEGRLQSKGTFPSQFKLKFTPQPAASLAASQSN